ncbi:hypothetical protein OF83DRAFT_1287653, partial [Amylostereum chailletii]
PPPTAAAPAPPPPRRRPLRPLHRPRDARVRGQHPARQRRHDPALERRVRAPRRRRRPRPPRVPRPARARGVGGRARAGARARRVLQPVFSAAAAGREGRGRRGARRGRRGRGDGGVRGDVIGRVEARVCVCVCVLGGVWSTERASVSCLRRGARPSVVRSPFFSVQNVGHANFCGRGLEIGIPALPLRLFSATFCVLVRSPCFLWYYEPPSLLVSSSSSSFLLYPPGGGG